MIGRIKNKERVFEKFRGRDGGGLVAGQVCAYIDVSVELHSVLNCCVICVANTYKESLYIYIYLVVW